MLYFILSRCITNFGIQFLPELFLSKSFNSLYKNILFIDKSHVLQKNGILKEISVKNHLYQFSGVSSFDIDKKGPFELKRIGINDVYTFPGFCKIHDSKITLPLIAN